jgi:Trp operon repressor
MLVTRDERVSIIKENDIIKKIIRKGMIENETKKRY